MIIVLHRLFNLWQSQRRDRKDHIQGLSTGHLVITNLNLRNKSFFLHFSGCVVSVLAQNGSWALSSKCFSWHFSGWTTQPQPEVYERCFVNAIWIFSKICDHGSGRFQITISKWVEGVRLWTRSGGGWGGGGQSIKAPWPTLFFTDSSGSF